MNAEASGAILDQIAARDAESRALIIKASERLGLSARGYHRILRTARTIADPDASEALRGNPIACRFCRAGDATIASRPGLRR